MKRKVERPYDPYAELLGRLNETSVDYVVIGMSGINYYAESALDTFGTQDYDLFLRPHLENAVRAFRVFAGLGYEMSTMQGRITEKDLKRILKEKRTVFAVNSEGVTFELLFAVSGFTFGQMGMDAAIFKAGDALVRVAKLSNLLASKKAANRPKDRLFLKRYEMILRQRNNDWNSDIGET